MPIKDNGQIRIECEFASREELVSIDYNRIDHVYFEAKVSASQAGSSIKAPIVFEEEEFSSFLLSLKGYDESLEIPDDVITLKDFTHQNGIVIGPFVPHRGILFVDICIGYNGNPLIRPGTFECDYDGETAYKRCRSEIKNYPFFPMLSSIRSDEEDPLLNRLLTGECRTSEFLKEIETLKEKRSDKNRSSDLTFGTKLQVCGLQFHRRQIRSIVENQFIELGL